MIFVSGLHTRWVKKQKTLEANSCFSFNQPKEAKGKIFRILEFKHSRAESSLPDFIENHKSKQMLPGPNYHFTYRQQRPALDRKCSEPILQVQAALPGQTFFMELTGVFLSVRCVDLYSKVDTIHRMQLK